VNHTLVTIKKKSRPPRVPKNSNQSSKNGKQNNMNRIALMIDSNAGGPCHVNSVMA
jgi:hypothetical protein